MHLSADKNTEKTENYRSKFYGWKTRNITNKLQHIKNTIKLFIITCLNRLACLKYFRYNNKHNTRTSIEIEKLQKMQNFYLKLRKIYSK